VVKVQLHSTGAASRWLRSSSTAETPDMRPIRKNPYILARSVWLV